MHKRACTCAKSYMTIIPTVLKAVSEDTMFTSYHRCRDGPGQRTEGIRRTLSTEVTEYRHNFIHVHGNFFGVF